jgi:ferric-dicitrate binding protein FerR (iron transport regulator)
MHDPDLERLFSALIDASISDADHARLERQLSADPAVRREFLSWMAMESALEWGAGNDAGTQPWTPPSPHAGTAGWSNRHAGMAGMAGMAGVAIAGVIAACVMMAGSRDKSPPVAETVRPFQAAVPVQATAWMSDLQQAQWHGDRIWHLGDAITTGPLRLTAGSAQLEFSSGAKVVLTAPADVEVLSPSRLFLRSGSITPFVPPAARGFTVVCPSGEVVDLGTEFSMQVDASGKADVYVIDGEVDVAVGHGPTAGRRRLTQGFGSSLLQTVSHEPRDTARPVIVDHFDGQSRPTEGCSPLAWTTWDRDCAAEVKDGSLQIPIDGTAGRQYPIVRVVADHDLPFAGNRTTITAKITLPDGGTADREHRWAGIVIDDAAQEKTPLAAYQPAVALGVLLSPNWQVAVWGRGEEVQKHHRVFTRDDDAVGPYQLVIVVDDSPAARKRNESATASVTVNGLEVLADYPLRLGSRPRLQFQTHTKHRDGGRGVVLVDDVSVSVALNAAGEYAAGEYAVGGNRPDAEAPLPVNALPSAD